MKAYRIVEGGKVSIFIGETLEDGLPITIMPRTGHSRIASCELLGEVMVDDEDVPEYTFTTWINSKVELAKFLTEIDELKRERRALHDELEEAHMLLAQHKDDEEWREEVDALQEKIDSLLAQNLRLGANRKAIKSAQQWQPIESVPKDGTPALLYAPECMGYGFYTGSGWGWHYGRLQPTHWMPAPEPPKEE